MQEWIHVLTKFLSLNFLITSIASSNHQTLPHFLNPILGEPCIYETIYVPFFSPLLATLGLALSVAFSVIVWGRAWLQRRKAATPDVNNLPVEIGQSTQGLCWLAVFLSTGAVLYFFLTAWSPIFDVFLVTDVLILIGAWLLFSWITKHNASGFWHRCVRYGLFILSFYVGLEIAVWTHTQAFEPLIFAAWNPVKWGLGIFSLLYYLPVWFSTLVSNSIGLPSFYPASWTELTIIHGIDFGFSILWSMLLGILGALAKPWIGKKLNIFRPSSIREV